MQAAQRVIKWLAVAFGIFLIGVILSVLVGVGYIMSEIFDGFDGWEDGEQTEVEIEAGEVEEFAGEVRELKADFKGTNLKIVSGNELKVETNNDRIRVKRNGESLVIQEDEGGAIFHGMESVQAVVYLPQGVEGLEKAEIVMGAGSLEISDLKAEELKLELGAGRTEIDGLEVARKAEVDGGAGMFELRNGEIRNLDFEMGVGNVSLSARLLGRSKISAGMGRLELELIGGENDYNVSFEQGLGSFLQEGISLNNPQGRNYVEIEGGVGAVVLKRS